MIGNPPWERIKQQKREFFAWVPEILLEPNAQKARDLIEKLSTKNPDLYERWNKALSGSESLSKYLRASKRFELTARGDVNTYMVFAELARKLVAPTGRVGLLVPSGIATDDTTKHFFNDVMEKQSLVGLYDFENRKGVFPDVDGRFKFSVLLMNGSAVKHPQASFVFFAHQIEDLADKERQISLSAKDLKLVNPNTRTCPIFRTKRDAELTKAIYNRIPVLVDENRKEGGNPWGIRFGTLFHQSGDAEHFKDAAWLQSQGYKQQGMTWTKKSDRYVPLYEAKNVQAYDHRASTVHTEKKNWTRQGQTSATTLVEHQNPEFVAVPRFWVPEKPVNEYFSGRPALIGFKNITSATNQRTMIAAWVPPTGFVDSLPVCRFDIAALGERRLCCLLANWNAFAFDFVARQKVGGLHLSYFIVEQLPTLPPEAYEERCPWDKKRTLEEWISERVLRLTCVSDDMRALAEGAGFGPGVVKWKEEEREEIRAELDAAYFRLYGIGEEDVEYILGTFQGVVEEDEAHGGAGRTRKLIREAMERMG